MAQWVSHGRASTLDEMICMEGRGSYIRSICAECSKPQPTLRCEDCFGGELFCQDCIVKLHICNPLHSIKVFDFLLPFYHQYLTGSIALEWDLLRRHNSEVFGASHSTWSPSWRLLHQPQACLRGRFRHHRFTWYSRSWGGLLWL